MSRQAFINALVTVQQRAFSATSRGVMSPDALDRLRKSADAAMVEVERAASEKAWDAAIAENAPDDVDMLWAANPYRERGAV